MPESSAEWRDGLASLVAGISASLLAASPERFDEALRHAIERLVLFFDADRGGLALLGPDGTFRVVSSFAREGIAPVPERLAEYAPSWVKRARAGEGLVLRRVEDLPESWKEERDYARSIGMKSHLMFPLRAGSTPIGAIAIASMSKERDWTAGLLDRFRLFGEVLASAILRSRREQELRASFAEISRLKERLEAENVVLREGERAGRGLDEIVGQSPALGRVLHLVEQVAPTQTTVLVTGETGTGKELIARAVCSLSSRSERPLVTVNCAALPGTLIESELFGFERGAFTGALQRRIGRFEIANGGTILLDEIGDLPQDIQGRFLRVLQEGTFERLGSSQSIKVDVRVIAVTNRDLTAAVAEGRLRADLFYRLRVFPIEVPPLRERREDIPLLASYFVTRKRRALGRKVSRIADRTMTAFQRYDWPGNVRELENVVERALILSPGETLVVDERFLEAPGPGPAEGRPLRLEDVERAHILRVLNECGWKLAGRGNAAERLGLNRSTLRSRLEKLGIARPAERSTARGPGPGTRRRRASG